MTSTSRRYNPYLLVGNRVTLDLRRPAAAQDGQSPVWDNAQRKFKPGGVSSGFSFTDFDASVNHLPTDPAIKRGEAFRFYPNGGVMPDTNFWNAGTLAVATVDNPGNDMNNWRLF